MFAVASDDAHDYLSEFAPLKATPGKGWIVVRVKELKPAAILEAMEQGDFYASIGVVLNDIRITAQEYALTVEPWKDAAFTITFIGKNGKVLKEDFSLTPSYPFRGDEMYVRARIESSNRELAWTQPFFLKR